MTADVDVSPVSFVHDNLDSSREHPQQHPQRRLLSEAAVDIDDVHDLRNQFSVDRLSRRDLELISPPASMCSANGTTRAHTRFFDNLVTAAPSEANADAVPQPVAETRRSSDVNRTVKQAKVAMKNRRRRKRKIDPRTVERFLIEPSLRDDEDDIATTPGSDENRISSASTGESPHRRSSARGCCRSMNGCLNPNNDCMPWLPILSPEKKWYIRIWIPLIFTALMYTATLETFRLCFLTAEDSRTFWEVTTILVDIIFVVDLLLNFRLMYQRSDDGMLEQRGNRIFYHYLCTWFIFDLLACLPLIAAAVPDFDTDSTGFNAIRLLRLLRLIRLFKVLQHRALLSGVFHRFLSEAWAEFALFGVFLATAIHVIACIWYLIARAEDFSQRSWPRRQLSSFDETCDDLQYLDTEELIDQCIRPLGVRYVASVYWVVTTVTTVGYGDITPNTPAEYVFAMAIMCLGVAVYAQIISRVANILALRDKNRKLRNQRLSHLVEFCSNAEIDLKLIKDLNDLMLAHSETDTSLNPQQVASIMGTFPMEVRTKLAYSMHGGRHLSLDIFSDSRNKNALICHLAPLLQRVVKSPVDEKNGLIWKVGDIADQVVFVVRGQVGVEAPSDSAQDEAKGDGPRPPLWFYKEGSYFGEVELFCQEHRQFSVRAYSDAELFALDAAALFQTFCAFPHLLMSMQRDATEKLKYFCVHPRLHAEQFRASLKTRRNLVAHHRSARGISDVSDLGMHREKVDTSGVLSYHREFSRGSSHHKDTKLGKSDLMDESDDSASPYENSSKLVKQQESLLRLVKDDLLPAIDDMELKLHTLLLAQQRTMS
ncbi:hypothetical protein FOZ61_005784 [Perkinsus olseni]|uniref:Cyclic nucleotide-binding domain-containing protein n=1 Tax=Perkinsus olseni TaxID=32597 RepID=A0A7J6MRN0_PEROL|nr:hypothetical protein FOZ61_005784 [Perkinsus olseni]KAF4674164.1 hypothetical protein FOL46_005709 [Perkinsus olseni]